MKRPNFLVIGGTRCGSSWLYRLLKSHPEIYVPTNIKEVHFFNRHYEKGWQWYEKLFTKASDGLRAVGEVTPEYISDEKTPKRVKQDIPETRFIISLRNPVDKLYSSYANDVLYHGIKCSFEEYFRQRRSTYHKALYSAQLKRWFAEFPCEQFLILIFEEMIKHPEKAASRISRFLGVDENGFDKSIFKEKTNYSYTPRFHKLFLIGIRLNEFLVARRLYGLSKVIVRCGRIFKSKRVKKRELDPELRKVLYAEYKDDIAETERLIGRSLDIWRKKNTE